MSWSPAQSKSNLRIKRRTVYDFIRLLCLVENVGDIWSAHSRWFSSSVQVLIAGNIETHRVLQPPQQQLNLRDIWYA